MICDRRGGSEAAQFLRPKMAKQEMVRQNGFSCDRHDANWSPLRAGTDPRCVAELLLRPRPVTSTATGDCPCGWEKAQCPASKSGCHQRWHKISVECEADHRPRTILNASFAVEPRQPRSGDKSILSGPGPPPGSSGRRGSKYRDVDRRSGGRMLATPSDLAASLSPRPIVVRRRAIIRVQCDPATLSARLCCRHFWP